MRRFGYALDPVCLAACLLYAANRWLLPESLQTPFWRGHFSDLLLIPAALPVVLWLQRRLGLRGDDLPPRWREILFHLAVWSVAAETLAPHLFRRSTGDLWDVVAYATGAVLAGGAWMLG